MKPLRAICLLTLLMAQWGCSDDELGPPAVEFGAPGVYKLRTVGAEPLPYGIRSSDSKGTVWAWVLGETLRIGADGHFQLTHTESGLGTNSTSAGTYTVVNDSTIELPGGSRLVVSGAVATIASCANASRCVYVREGADAGPSLTYTVHNLQTVNGGPPSAVDWRVAAVSGATVWLWADGRYRRDTSIRGLPGSSREDGTYQLSGTTITLNRSYSVAYPDLYPLAGTYAGGMLTLGTHGYAPATLP
ncbi:MAG TPA: hypothetical protein VF710_25315 [Longimicrobium sp.]|jgi:hypothetical protein